jgi:hypothetical protein
MALSTKRESAVGYQILRVLLPGMFVFNHLLLPMPLKILNETFENLAMCPAN